MLSSSDWILGLNHTGILKVAGIKPADGEAAETALRSIASKIGVLHRRIHPTDINVLMPAPKNVSLDKAYTGGKLEYHTDAPYYEPPPKLRAASKDRIPVLPDQRRWRSADQLANRWA